MGFIENCWLDKFVMVYTLQDAGKYGRAVVYTKGDEIKSEAVNGLVVSLDSVFVG